MTELAMPNERAHCGKFLPGHSVKSPGRPKKEKVEDVNYLGLLRQAMTADEALAIIRQAIVDAKKGSRHARTWLFKHLMPEFPRVNQHEFSLLEPEQRTNDGKDVASPEFRLFCECCQTEDELHVFVKLYERAQGVRSGKLMFDPSYTTRLIPAPSEKETVA